MQKTEMRYLLLADIHSNLEALEAVLTAVEGEKIDKYCLLGDMVGYGANPNEVVERLKPLVPQVMVRGNHEKVALGVENGSNLTDYAREAAYWTKGALTPESMVYLAGATKGPRIVDGLFEIVHGAVEDEDTYLDSLSDAMISFAYMNTPLCFFAHTHVPVIFSERDGQISSYRLQRSEENYQLQPDTRYLINPGSVGQPRDGDPRAAFGIYDSSTVLLIVKRVEYDLAAAQAKILETDLPSQSALRLSYGR